MKWKGALGSDPKCEHMKPMRATRLLPFFSNAKYNFSLPPSVTSHASKSVSFPSQHLRTQPSSFPSLLTLSTSPLPSSSTSPGTKFSLAWMATLSHPLLLLKLHTQSKNACSILCMAFGSSGLSSVVLWCRLPSDETIVFMVLHHLYRNCVLSPLLACFLICKAKNTYLTVWLYGLF